MRLAIGALLLLVASPAHAIDPRVAIDQPCARCARYHVAPDGDDDNAGDAAHPWRTLQHAAERVEAGDVVRVRAGTYRGFDLRRSGEPNRPIWFVGEKGAIIEGDNPETPDGINIEDADWVGIAGFRIRGAGRAGIRAVSCHHVFLAGNEAVDNFRWGIFTGFCEDVVIEDNETAGSRDEHGIYVSNSADRPVIRRNLIHDNAEAGIHMNGDASQGGDGIISEALVESNVIHDVGRKGAAGINADGVQRSAFRNNLIYRAHATGIALYRIDGADGSKDNVVVNNTIVVANDGRFALHLRGGSTGVLVRNNILLNENPSRGALDVMPDCFPGLSSDRNAVIDRQSTDDWETLIDLETWKTRTGQDRQSVVATAQTLFASGGFSLRNGSPALDVGSQEGTVPVDILGRKRPAGAGIDLGALELCTACERAAPPRTTAMLAKLTTAPPPAPSHGGGCAGCAIARLPHSKEWNAWLIALVFVALAMRRQGDWRVPRRKPLPFQGTPHDASFCCSAHFGHPCPRDRARRHPRYRACRTSAGASADRARA